jgi:hypothetical protein
LAAQITLRELGIMASHLPENIFLAVMGSLLGFCGIVIIHMREYYYSPITKISDHMRDIYKDIPNSVFLIWKIH